MSFAGSEGSKRPSAGVRVELLGPPRVLVDGRHVALPTGKPLALLAYLAAAGGAVSREHAADLLWPCGRRLQSVRHGVGPPASHRCVHDRRAGEWHATARGRGTDVHELESALVEERIEEDAHAWFVCRTRERRERRAQLWLGERGVDTYLPVVPRRERPGRFRGPGPPMFPGHLFFRTRWDIVRAVLHAPSVEGLVQSGRKPVVIADREIENIAQLEAALRASDLAVRPAELPEGPDVQVVRGPLKGVCGVLKEELWLVVGLAALGSGIAVELPERGATRLL